MMQSCNPAALHANVYAVDAVAMSKQKRTVNDFFGGFDGVFICGDDGSSGRKR